MKIYIPQKVKSIMSKLEENGYEAYMVGGCVRDSLLGRNPKDYDIATNALPNDVIEIFGHHRTIPTGLKHGTVTVVMDGESFEVTTYRTDMKYTDGRRPDEVKFESSIEKDLSRRDFTINAIAYNDKNGLIDIYNGRRDLDNKIIRCVGEPDERFKEDALRMMRAIRFSAELGFNIEDNTMDAIIKNKERLSKVSMERVTFELNRIILSHNTEKIYLLIQTMLMDYIEPKFNPLEPKSLKVLEFIENKLYLRIAALFIICDMNQYEARSILKRLKYDNNTTNKTVEIIKYSGLDIKEDTVYIRQNLSKMGLEVFLDILNLKIAFIMASESPCIDNGINRIEKVKKAAEDVINRNECIGIKDLAVSGEDIVGLGLKGKYVGDMLDELLSMVIVDPELNKRERLISVAQGKIGKK